MQQASSCPPAAWLSQAPWLSAESCGSLTAFPSQFLHDAPRPGSFRALLAAARGGRILLPELHVLPQLRTALGPAECDRGHIGAHGMAAGTA